jgi:hypothetical protein
VNPSDVEAPRNDCLRSGHFPVIVGFSRAEPESGSPPDFAEGELLTGGLQVRVLPEEFQKSPAD